MSSRSTSKGSSSKESSSTPSSRVYRKGRGRITGRSFAVPGSGRMNPAQSAPELRPGSNEYHHSDGSSTLPPLRANQVYLDPGSAMSMERSSSAPGLEQQARSSQEGYLSDGTSYEVRGEVGAACTLHKALSEGKTLASTLSVGKRRRRNSNISSVSLRRLLRCLNHPACDPAARGGTVHEAYHHMKCRLFKNKRL